MPNRVVAPISVNGCIDRFMERAFNPLSTTHETKKSSMAGYSISSTMRGNLCISSINKTSNFLS